jgi:ribosomal protein L37AE/L43A
MNFSVFRQRLKCPFCGHSDVNRSHRRNAIERLLKFVLTPWRCDVCDSRFHAFSWVKRVPAQQADKQTGA